MKRSAGNIVKRSVNGWLLALNAMKSQHTTFQYLQLRSFTKTTNDETRKTIDEMKKKFEQQANPTDSSGNEDVKAASESSNQSESNQEQPAKFDVSKLWENVKSKYQNVVSYWDDMSDDITESPLSRKVHQAATFRPAKKKGEDGEGTDDDEEAEEEKPIGTAGLVHVKDPKSAWEQMRDRFQDSPLIKEILKGSRKVGKAAAATPIGQQAQSAAKNVQDKISDAWEFWETSQNPMIYTLSGMWDNMTGETEEGMTIGAIRKLDPKFDKEEWALAAKDELVRKVISAHLRGDLKDVKSWLGEGVYSRLNADIRTRKHDGHVLDPNVLDLEENKLVLKLAESGEPTIVGIYMVQQIHCIRNRQGEIVEGNESDIRAKFYSLAFQQDYDDDAGIVSWKVVDYQFAGDMPYF